MAIVVQKFGGTSLRRPADRARAAGLVRRAMTAGDQPVVVVSAIGRAGDAYATDSLIHLLAHLPDPRPDERDLLLACGEIISAVVMAGHLRALGLNPEVFTGWDSVIVTDDTHGNAQIKEVNPSALLDALAAGRIPVVAGFQGKTPEGRISTLGRGGSDTTAVALGAAIRADLVEIYTDVDGIKTADPRIVPDARTIARLDYEEVFQLASLGARVIHPRAVEIGRQFAVPIRVRSTFSDAPGTLVAAGHTFDPWAHRHPARAITGVTQRDDLVQFVVLRPAQGSSDWQFRLFQQLGDNGVSVDLINLFVDRVFFCVPESARAVTGDTLDSLAFEYEAHPDRAKVSLVGSAIHGLPGVVGRMMEALTREDIPVLQTADSHSTITLLLERAHMERAVQALHGQFGLAAGDKSL